MIEGKEHEADPLETIPALIRGIILQKAKAHSFGTLTLQIEFKDGAVSDLRVTEETTHKFKKPKHD